MQELARRKSGQSGSVSRSEECAHRVSSDGAALQLGHEVIAGANAESHDGESRILAGIRSEAGSVHDKEILDVVGLLELIEDGFFRVGAHAGDAGFVERPARSGRMSVGANIFCASGFQHFSGGGAHVLDHGALVFAVGHMDFENGNSVNIFQIGIKLHEIIPAGENFAEAGDFDAGARLEKGFFVSFAEARGVPVELGAGLAFVAEAPEKFFVGRGVLQVAETRDVDAEWLYGAAERRLRVESGKFAAAAGAADMRGEVMAEDAAVIGETIRILRRSGVQEDTDGFLRLRAEDYGTGVDFAGLARVAIEEENAAGAVAIRVHENFVDHGVRDERAVAGGDGIGNGGEGGVEIRVRHAAAFAGAAEVAGAAAIEGLGEIGAARGHGGAAQLFLDAIAKEIFLTGERNGRLKLAVGEMLEAFGTARDANVFFDEIVVGLDIFVAERPVFAVTVVRGGFEIPIAEAQAYAAPNIGAAAGHPQATHPVEGLVGGSGVRLFEVVDEPVVVVFAADLKFGLDGTRLADDFFGEVAVFEFERWLVFGEILVGLWTASFEQRDLQAGFSKALAGPASGSAGTDHEDIVGLLFLFRHRIQIRNGC